MLVRWGARFRSDRSVGRQAATGFMLPAGVLGSAQPNLRLGTKRYAPKVRLSYKERHRPERAAGSEHPMQDAPGNAVIATIMAVTPIAEGWIEYEIEVPADVEPGSLTFISPSPAPDAWDDQVEPCPEKRFVGTRVEQCILDRGHFGPHQFRL